MSIDRVLNCFAPQFDPGLFSAIASDAAEWDMQNTWPDRSFNLLAENGILAWDFPLERGGFPATQADWMGLFIELSAACLTTSFVLSQRNAATQRMIACNNPSIHDRWFYDLISGAVWPTVGISHLSTSRRHLKEPAVKAIPTETGFRLQGEIPWVTGVGEADLLIAGGEQEDGTQILAVVPCDQPSVKWGSVQDLMALTSSCTGSCVLDDVEISKDDLVAGPIANVMKSGGGGTGSLTTSAIATGVALRAIRGLILEAENREDLREDAERLSSQVVELIDQMIPKNPDSTPPDAAAIRSQANSLVLRAAQAYLTAKKGSGFVAGHSAERTLREACFFLVWSCPQPVAQQVLRQFSCDPVWN